MDKRVMRTRGALDKALFELLQEKPIERISVKDISSHAGINRATFYSHYSGLGDMCETLRGEIVDDIVNIISLHREEIVENDKFGVVFDLFTYFDRGRVAFSSLLCDHCDPEFYPLLLTTAHERFSPTKYFYGETEADPVLVDAACNAQFDFLIGGVFCIAENWLNGNNEMSLLQAVHLATGLAQTTTHDTTIDNIENYLEQQKATEEPEEELAEEAEETAETAGEPEEELAEGAEEAETEDSAIEEAAGEPAEELAAETEEAEESPENGTVEEADEKPEGEPVAEAAGELEEAGNEPEDSENESDKEFKELLDKSLLRIRRAHITFTPFQQIQIVRKPRRRKAKQQP